MEKIIVAAVASLSIFNAGAAFAQAAIGEPGLYAFYHPEGDVLRAGPRPHADLLQALASQPIVKAVRRQGQSGRSARH